MVSFTKPSSKKVDVIIKCMVDFTIFGDVLIKSPPSFHQKKVDVIIKRMVDFAIFGYVLIKSPLITQGLHLQIGHRLW